MDIFWTPTARRTYFKVLDHLEEAWTEQEIQNYINEVHNLLEKELQLLLFWDNRQDPEKLPY